MIQRVGIVVPTLGERPEYLLECLQSIRKAGRAHVLLVAPNGFDPPASNKDGFRRPVCFGRRARLARGH